MPENEVPSNAVPNNSDPNSEKNLPQAIPVVPGKNGIIYPQEQDIPPAVKRWGIRAAVIIIGLLALQIPLYMVRDLAKSRAENSRQAQQEISEGWGGRQCINDVCLGEVSPESLTVETVLNPEIRSRGIYQSAVYTSTSKIVAEFAGAGKKVTLDLIDLRGVQDVSAKINGQTAQVKLKAPSMIEIEVPPAATGALKCEIQLDLRGSRGFDVEACAKKNQVTISGAWDSPNLADGILPNTRKVEDDHFSAQWKINKVEGAVEPVPRRISVGLHISAGTYQQVERVMTYATFFLIVFFFSLVVGELVTKTAIHPVQYLIAAGAPVLFYMMLLAFAEKIPFAWAYLLSAAVIVLMVGGYARMFLRRAVPAAVLGAVLAGGYAVNYFILQMEEFALISGTVVLAVVLGVAMALTGKLNAVKPE